MAELETLLLKLDWLITMARLNEMALIVQTDRGERLGRMLATLRRLKPGAYLLGTGPSTTGIIPLTVDEIVLGRIATPVETPAETVIDYAVADTLYFGPRETSRVHAKVVRTGQRGAAEFQVVDLNSTCGTYVNEERVGGDGHALEHGDVLSLGPSQVNTYLFFVITSDMFEGLGEGGSDA